MSEEKEIQLASELRFIIGRLSKKIRKTSATAERLSLTERSTMALIFQHEEILPNELAAMEKITTQSMSQILSNLLNLGLIKRRISELDKRKVIISLSEEGINLIHKSRSEKDEWLNRALEATCTAGEQEMLKKALVPLAKLVEFD
ncbi:MarR family winged helix-turn-helix transcriptional regulator [Mucilaginibacter sp. cycad4]|uniref:MarR family winged helix-turn-helix transcriptional regulator n=1 Tax=Mucilaginibacter sp. cycad4 TaxID=3342096 RepID=UPI002AAB182B|nr:MarR family winged helix-turn-helix transcriptional regulator [Mucilaginibacter gossypii]WPU97228.1 MarR family winged helix-turn-helix transcriptional regulator [Mucilaginibacter gossypii]